MNYKLEKFWNKGIFEMIGTAFMMNYKLEKFWNKLSGKRRKPWLYEL